MLVQSKFAKIHINNLREAFVTLQKYQIKLNPATYAFGVTSEKFLNFMISNRGIEANPKKIKVVQEMGSLSMIKDIQCLIGRITALSQFVSRSAKRCLSFFQVLKQLKNFQWTEEY